MLLKKIDTWLSIVFFATGVVVYMMASGFDDIPSRFPILLAISFMVLSALLFVNTFFKVRRQNGPEEAPAHGCHRYIMPAMVTVVMCAYAAALEFAGFIAPSVLLMLFVGWVLGYRRSGLLLLVSLLFVLAVYGVFGVLLGVPLPRLPFME